jgi:poly-gamma-glutamate synthesis protein (capsule biosynthesis protein)
MYGREGSKLTLAAAGDAILNRRWSTCEAEGFRELIDVVRDADASVVNLEVLFHEFNVPPSASSGGTYMRAPPWVADELDWAGFNLFSAATNHIGDYSIEGMRETMRVLDDRELVYAGLGEDLATARAPAYLDTGGGRVGIVSTCTTRTAGSEAGEQRPDLQGRPGLSPLGLETKFVLTEDAMAQLRELSSLLGLDETKQSLKEMRPSRYFTDESDEKFYFFNPSGAHTGDTLTFEVGDDPGVYQVAKTEDVDAITNQIRLAERQSDWVVATLHAHEGENGKINESSVAPFIESFARRCVDAGADIFVGHGPHVLRGIEIYDGVPIFYSLGNFASQSELVERLPTEIYERYDLTPEALPDELFDARMFDEEGDRIGSLTNNEMYESVLPLCQYDHGTLDRVKLYPVNLCMSEPRPRRGRPVRATGATADRILRRLSELSEPYGTKIQTDDGVGIIEV